MRFGNPLAASPGAANPSTRLDRQVVSPLATIILPSATTGYDVSAFTGIFVSMFPGGAWAANRANVTFNWLDAQQNPITASGATVSVDQNGWPTFYLRNLGPYLQVGAGFFPAFCSQTIQLWGTNVTQQFAGPYMPNQQGTRLVLATDAFGGVGSATHFLSRPYCGPAFLSGQNTAAGTSFVQLVDTATGLTIVQLDLSRAPASTPNAASVPVWIPPTQVQVTNGNGGTPQSVQCSLIAA